MTAPKRKVSVTLDADLVDEITAEGENLSARVNQALLADLAARRRQRALGRLVERLKEEEGITNDSPEYEAAVRRAMIQLGGTSEQLDR